MKDLWTFAEPTVKDAGFEICELQWGREPAGWVLRLYIDRPALSPDGTTSDATLAGLRAEQPVGHGDCERVSRDLSAALDAADKIPHAYSLEVSSPGLDRPLRREADFARYAGRQARVRLENGVGGRRNFSGVLRGAHDGRVAIECDGQTHELPVDDVARAHLVPDWDAEFKQRSAS